MFDGEFGVVLFLDLLGLLEELFLNFLLPDLRFKPPPSKIVFLFYGISGSLSNHVFGYSY